MDPAKLHIFPQNVSPEFIRAGFDDNGLEKLP
jgi:hypothetical protein